MEFCSHVFSPYLEKDIDFRSFDCGGIHLFYRFYWRYINLYTVCIVTLSIIIITTIVLATYSHPYTGYWSNNRWSSNLPSSHARHWISTSQYISANLSSSTSSSSVYIRSTNIFWSYQTWTWLWVIGLFATLHMFSGTHYLMNCNFYLHLKFSDVT